MVEALNAELEVIRSQLARKDEECTWGGKIDMLKGVISEMREAGQNGSKKWRILSWADRLEMNLPEHDSDTQHGDHFPDIRKMVQENEAMRDLLRRINTRIEEADDDDPIILADIQDLIENKNNYISKSASWCNGSCQRCIHGNGFNCSINAQATCYKNGFANFIHR